MKRILFFASLFAAILLASATLPAYAADAETVATNFTTLMTNVARLAAAGCFFGGLTICVIGMLAGMGKLAATGKAAAAGGVMLGVATALFNFFTTTGSKLLG